MKISFFTRARAVELDEMTNAGAVVIVAEARKSVAKVLDQANDAKAILEARIADLQEELRQTNVVIAAFSPTVPALADATDGRAE